jgi:hypothetical protein
MPLPSAATLNPDAFWSGHHPSSLDHRDYRYALIAPEAAAIPEAYDFEAQRPLPVMDQAAVPACVAYTLAGLKTAQEDVEVGSTLPFDPQAIYTIIKTPAGGATYRSGFDFLLNVGAPANGTYYRISSYAGVAPTSHDEVKHALVTSGVLAAGMHVPRSFTGTGGNEFDFAPGGDPDEIVGGHALLVVGWTAFGPILHNSWGTKWGDQGRTTVSWAWWDRYVFEVWASVDASDEAVQAKVAALSAPVLPLTA